MNTHEPWTSAARGISKCEWENRGNYTFLSKPRLALSLIKINTYFYNSSFEWSIFSLSHMIPTHIYHHQASILIVRKWESRVKSTKINRRNVKNLYARESERKKEKITKLISQLIVSLRSFFCVRCLCDDDDDDTEIRPREKAYQTSTSPASHFLSFSRLLLFYINLEFILHMCFTKRVYTEKITRVQDIIFSLPVCVAACGRTKNEFYESNEFQISNWPWSATP